MIHQHDVVDVTVREARTVARSVLEGRPSAPISEDLTGMSAMAAHVY
jgi:hypothetical protein